MLVRSNLFACATASMTSTMSFGQGPRSSVVSAISSAVFSVKREERVTLRPLRLHHLAAAKLGKRPGRDADALRDCRLSKAGVLDFRDDFVPVHADSFSTNRNNTLRQVETQLLENSQMSSLSNRITETREEKGWSKAELRRAAGLKSPSTLTELESGQRTESPQLPKIAAALGVEVLWLQHGTGPKRRKDIALATSTAAEIAALANELPARQQAELLHYLKFAKLLREAGVSDDLIDAIRQSSG